MTTTEAQEKINQAQRAMADIRANTTILVNGYAVRRLDSVQLIIQALEKYIEVFEKFIDNQEGS